MSREGFFGGRGLLIVLAMFVAGGSFALGFFVGKATDSANIAKEVVSGPSAAEPVLLPHLPPKPRTTEDAKTKEALPAVEGVREVAKPPKEALPRKPKESAETKAAFSVQTGAFKSAEEADALKKRLEAKGFEVYILSRGQESPLYKVRVGRYEGRKEAEETALRLRESEGINAFVSGD